jgi:uroporphyrinogen decarboxylase
VRDGKSKETTKGPLSGACSIADIEKFEWPDPQWWQPGDFAQARKRWSDHALVFYPRWMPLFWDACEAFGMEEALINMACASAVLQAFIRRYHAFYMRILENGVAAARGVCDMVWLGDDYASQWALLHEPCFMADAYQTLPRPAGAPDPRQWNGNQTVSVSNNVYFLR